MRELWKLVSNSGDYLLFAAALVVVLVLFLRDFGLKSPRSWLILIGLSGIGVAMVMRAIRQNNLLKELEERERALKEVEERYAALKAEGKITEENYKKAKAELEVAKKKAARDILTADEEYREGLEAIDREYAGMTPDETIERSRQLLQGRR